jgi:hypothetical protein
MTNTFATPSWDTADGTSGTANTGGGGGGASYEPSATPSGPFSGGGGSGIVIIKEENGNWSAGGMWSLKQMFQQKVEGNWL